MRAHLADCGLGGVIEELLANDTAYLNRATDLDEARNTLAHALDLQRLRVEVPETLSEAENAFANETSQENWERLQEAIRGKRDIERVEAELPDDIGRSRTGTPS